MPICVFRCRGCRCLQFCLYRFYRKCEGRHDAARKDGLYLGERTPAAPIAGRRPALVVQADRYNRRRAAAIIAAITSTHARQALASKVAVARSSRAGREAGLRLDSLIDCQTLATIAREEILKRLGRLPADVMQRVDRALQDAVDLPALPGS